MIKKILYINKRILNTREKELKIQTEELNMSTNFEKLNMWNVTDRDALFIVGTKREKMEHLENSLFCHPLRKFDRTDKNKNGVIDADELLSRIKKERNGRIFKCFVETLATLGSVTTMYKGIQQAKYGRASLMLILGILTTLGGISDMFRLPEENREIRVLKEYIKLQEAENASA